MRQINTKTILEWVHKQFVTTVHLGYFFNLTGHNEFINENKRDNIHIATTSHSLGLHSIDDVKINFVDITTTRQLWYDHLKSYIPTRQMPTLFTAGRLRNTEAYIISSLFSTTFESTLGVHGFAITDEIFQLNTWWTGASFTDIIYQEVPFNIAPKSHYTIWQVWKQRNWVMKWLDRFGFWQAQKCRTT